MPKTVPVATREEVEEEPTSTLRLQLSAQRILMLQAARVLMGQRDGRPPNDEHFWGMLLAESMSTLTDPKTGELACKSERHALSHRLRAGEVDDEDQIADVRRRLRTIEDRLDSR